MDKNRSIVRSKQERRNELFKVVLPLFLSLALLSCAERAKVNNEASTEVEYELKERGFLSFRRAYHGHDTLTGKELEVFMNRNPEGGTEVMGMKNTSLYSELVEANIIKDGNLNIGEIDTLSKAFDYQISVDRIIHVETRLLDDPKEEEELSYELIFREDGKSLFVDSLEYGFPPDVTFFTRDLGNDGSHELMALFKWYIVNGDNYDLRIYNFKEKPHQSED